MVLYQLSYLGTAETIVIDRRKMSNQSKLCFLTVLVVMLPGMSGCMRRQAPPPDGRTPKNPAALERSDRPPARESSAEYGWDGQASSTTVNGTPATYYPRSVAALRAMDFVINEEGSKQGKMVQGAKTDHTTATVWLEEKEGKTTLRVKVGSLGDRTGSERVLDEIQRPPGTRKK